MALPMHLIPAGNEITHFTGLDESPVTHSKRMLILFSARLARYSVPEVAIYECKERRLIKKSIRVPKMLHYW